MKLLFRNLKILKSFFNDKKAVGFDELVYFNLSLYIKHNQPEISLLFLILENLNLNDFLFLSHDAINPYFFGIICFAVHREDLVALLVGNDVETAEFGTANHWSRNDIAHTLGTFSLLIAFTYLFVSGLLKKYKGEYPVNCLYDQANIKLLTQMFFGPKNNDLFDLLKSEDLRQINLFFVQTIIKLTV